MDDFGIPQRRRRGAVVTWRVPLNHDAGAPFAGSDITIDGKLQGPVHDAHYLVRADGRGTIRRYCGDTDTLQYPAGRAAPLWPPFDIVGRIVRLIRPL
jgi:hypothetical protein